MSQVILLVLAIVAGVFAGRQEGDPRPAGRAAWARHIAYWIFTILVAYELTAGAWWDLLDIKFIRLLLARLGYPPYFAYIIGVPRIPFVLAVLLPRLPRLKEWAYAWTFFTYGGIALSEYLVHDELWIRTLVFSGIVLVSSILRPPSRKLGNPAPTIGASAIAWLVPAMIAVSMAVIAYINVPTGSLPQ